MPRSWRRRILAGSAKQTENGGGGLEGYSDASQALNVTRELVRRGYTEQQIAKLWSGNLLRVMREVEKVAANLQKRGN